MSRWVSPRSPESEAVDIVTYGGFGLILLFLLMLPRIVVFLVKTRLIVPVLYALVVRFYFSAWEAAHIKLSNNITIALIVLVFVSWIVELILAIRKRLKRQRNGEL